MYKTILIPIDVDHSESAQEMIYYAKRHSNKHTKIILLNVIDIVPAWTSSYLQASVLTENRKKVSKKLDLIAKESELENIEVIIKNGHSYRTILEVADKEEVGLIIIGSHKPGVGSYFLGYTADKVVRHAKCSVFIIRE